MSLPFSSFVRPQMSALFLLSYSSVFIKLISRGNRNLLHRNFYMPTAAWAHPQDQSATKHTVVTLFEISIKGGVLGIRLYRITLDYDTSLTSTLDIQDVPGGKVNILGGHSIGPSC